MMIWLLNKNSMNVPETHNTLKHEGEVVPTV